MDSDAKKYLEQFGKVRAPKPGEKIVPARREPRSSAWERFKNPEVKPVPKAKNETFTKQNAFGKVVV